jgi:hypothetical protein
MSLYSRLFKYSPRADRKPIENFLTEALYDLLERMTTLDRKCMEGFITEILVGSHAPESFHDTLTAARSLRWQTQKVIYCAGDRGYVDLCLMADERIMLVVENKIAAAFTCHPAPDDSVEPNDDLVNENWNQLGFYERYLAEESPGAGLVLLTHFTEAPRTFLLKGAGEKDELAEEIFRRVCRWSDVYKWISLWQLSVAKDCKVDPAINLLRMLAREFALFLEEQRMNITEMTNDDLELMRTVFSHNLPRKMRDFMRLTRNSVVLLPEVVKAEQYGRANALLDKEHQLVWDWVYCFDKGLKWFIGWGISARDGLSGYLIEFDSPVKCFVLLGSDRREIPLSNAQFEAYRDVGWTIHEPRPDQKLRLVKTIEPLQLVQNGADFNHSFEQWVTAVVKEGIALLDSARGSFKSNG